MQDSPLAKRKMREFHRWWRSWKGGHGGHCSDDNLSFSNDQHYRPERNKEKRIFLFEIESNEEKKIKRAEKKINVKHIAKSKSCI